MSPVAVHDSARRSPEATHLTRTRARPYELNHLVTLEALPTSEVEQFIDSTDHRPALRCSDDPHATSTSEVEQSFVAQLVECADHRVLVDLEDCRKIDGRWQTFTLYDLTLGDCSANLRRHLLIDRDRVVPIDIAESHSTI